MTSDNTMHHSLDQLDAMSDEALCQVDWKSLNCFNGRLLDLHAEGRLGNEFLAKLPRRPILCIDRIERIDEEAIEASFTFPEDSSSWAFHPDESLEMLFQDQLDQLVGFWGCRKADGIGRALSSGSCKLHQSLNYAGGKTLRYVLEKRKWMENKVAGSGGTAVFNGRILTDDGEVALDTKNVIVGILNPADIQALRQQHGGTGGVSAPSGSESQLRIPVYDESSIDVTKDGDKLTRVHATQSITPALWPLGYHFKGDPVVPGNFGTHGMIALVKEIAIARFGLKAPVFTALVTKKFSGMIFEDPKQIRFELLNVEQTDAGAVVAEEANLYLETSAGERMIDDPIYTFKKITVAD
jgi:3-hydroxymyristoyl/3-hydroxydecanoyl-(acyl carrier protein) dehydratase